MYCVVMYDYISYIIYPCICYGGDVVWVFDSHPVLPIWDK